MESRVKLLRQKTNRIGELIDASSKTLKIISEEVGISYSTLGNYNQGTRTPKKENAQKLADYFGVSVPYLLGLDSIHRTDDPRKCQVIDKLLRISNQRMLLLEQLLSLEEEEGRLLEQL